jgi:hypothetical protein
MRLEELRRAARALRASPGLSLVVVATLGLGIGFTTAMFSVVHAVLLRPLPFEDPDRLIVLWTTVPKDGRARFRVSSFDYLQWREQSDLFERLALTGAASATLTGREGRSNFLLLMAAGLGPAVQGLVLGLGGALPGPTSRKRALRRDAGRS